MFTKQEREKIGVLSLALFGSSSKWQKLIEDDPAFRIVEGFTKDTSVPEYVRFKQANNKLSGSMKRETAVKLGKVQATESAYAGANRPITRAPTFDELYNALKQNIDFVKLSQMGTSEMIQVLAHKIVNEDFKSVPKLHKKNDEEYTKNLEDLLKTMPEKNSTLLKTFISEEEGLDAIQFVTDYSFALNHKEQSSAMAEDSLKAFDLPVVRNDKDLIQKSRVISDKNNIPKKLKNIGLSADKIKEDIYGHLKVLKDKKNTKRKQERQRRKANRS